eukprot:gb/GFBE01018374.1/.p1 GENE.gb/GFBE01018374.1/~~gb/GFBE01018374.1/.p1  ORF type:complete len:389 (+),score=128.84 gb/GFBE01018374.1/:1-1167(+)
MEKPDHSADVSKLKGKPILGRFAGLVQPWAVGAAGAGLLLLGFGAWTLQRSQERGLHPHSSSWHNGRGHQVFEPKRNRVLTEQEEEGDSLEDVLSKLEGGEPLSAALPRKSIATVGSRTPKKQKAKSAKKKQDVPIPDPLKDEPSEDEKEKAREIIRDTLKKLESEGKGKKDSKTRKTIAKLKALLGEEPDEDAEPEEEEESLSEDEQSHFDFAKALQAEQQRKVHVELKTVRSEFKKDFGDDSKALLCSGCKLVAARLTSELDTHDVHEQESPAQMLAAKRKAIDSTCSSLRHLQAVKPEGGSARFEASEVTGEGEREGKRLCAAILEESRFDILARLIQRKIPDMQQHLYGGGRSDHNNWERWLCAERMRLCKRSEVKDDDEDEEA